MNSACARALSAPPYPFSGPQELHINGDGLNFQPPMEPKAPKICGGGPGVPSKKRNVGLPQKKFITIEHTLQQSIAVLKSIPEFLRLRSPQDFWVVSTDK